MKEKLKNLDLKLTELAGYMNVSRPTLYKFLEMYIYGEQEKLKEDVLDLFNYIDRDDVVTKKQVLRYILQKDNSSKGRASPKRNRRKVEDPKLVKIDQLIRNLNDKQKEHLINYIELITREGSNDND